MNQQKKIKSIAGCLVIQLCIGILYVWSIFRQPAIDYFGWSTVSANLVSSIMLFAFCAGNFLGGSLQDKIGPKKACLVGVGLFGVGILSSSLLPPTSPILLFYITYGVIAGMGSGFAYGPVLCYIQRWFPDKRGFATGLAASVFGFSTVVFAPVINSLTAAVGISKCLLILGICFLVIGMSACFFISIPKEIQAGSQTKQDNSKTLGQAVKTLPFWLLFIGCFLYNGTWNMLTPLIKGLGIERGLTDTAATLCVSITGIANAAGRLLMSSISDKIGRTAVLIILSVTTAASGFLLIFSGNWLYFAVVLLCAFAYGGPAAVYPAIATDIFGSRHSGANYGVIMMSLGISSIVFNSISSAVIEATGEYTITFIIGITSAALALLVNIVIKKISRSYLH